MNWTASLGHCALALIAFSLFCFWVSQEMFSWLSLSPVSRFVRKFEEALIDFLLFSVSGGFCVFSSMGWSKQAHY